MAGEQIRCVRCVWKCRVGREKKEEIEQRVQKVADKKEVNIFCMEM